MKMLKMIAAAVVTLAGQQVSAASGEMGTGVPQFGSYSSPTGTMIRVWSLAEQTRPFAAGCSYIVLDPDTMGMEAYKIAVALITTAKVTGMKVRFYAHGEHDGGCGADYVELDG